MNWRRESREIVLCMMDLPEPYSVDLGEAGAPEGPASAVLPAAMCTAARMR